MNGDWHIFAPFFQLDVWESRQSEVQPQIFHRAAVHVETLQGLLQGLPSLTNIDSYDKQKTFQISVGFEKCNMYVIPLYVSLNGCVYVEVRGQSSHVICLALSSSSGG